MAVDIDGCDSVENGQPAPRFEIYELSKETQSVYPDEGMYVLPSDKHDAHTPILKDRHLPRGKRRK